MNDDLISRQAAIDAVWSLDVELRPSAIDAILNRLKGLPSTQHEPIRLRLDHELSKEEYERLKKDCAEQPIILLPKESAQRWIPCSERLPEEFYALCCDNNGEMLIANPFECDDSDTGFSAESEDCYMYNCVAWMPLPEPYKGEES